MKRNIETTRITRSETETAGAPRSLQELGLPRELALRFEAAFRKVGATRGDQIVGFAFRTPGGVRHALRLNRSVEAANQAVATDRAA